MKKFGALLSFIFLLSSSFFIVGGLTSCDPEDTLDIDNGGNTNGGGSGVEETTSGTIKAVNTTLNYESTKANSALNNSLSASTGSVVALTSSDADLVFLYQDSYGKMVASPNADYISQLRGYNNYGGYTKPSRYTNIKKVSNSLNYYADIETLANMSVSSDYIGGKQSLGKGVSNLSSGDVIIYETSSGEKGALQITTGTFSKVSGTFTVKGYIYLPNSSSSSK